MNINNLYCIDNVEGMEQLPDNFVDLTVTSPPYDGLRTYNGYSFDFENVAKQLFRRKLHIYCSNRLSHFSTSKTTFGLSP